MIRQLRFLATAAALAAFCGVAYSGPVFTIDFETEDDFATPLVHGQSIYSTPRADNVSPAVPFSTDSVLEFGNLFNVSSTVIGSDGHLGPAIFDSDPADTTSTGDPDLLVGLGNVLMLQADESSSTTLDATYGLVFDTPNDEATAADRGSIVFDFLVTNVHPISIDLVDVNGGVIMNVILTDNAGLQRTYSVPSKWTTDVTVDPSGFQTLSLETLLNQPAEPLAIGGDATAVEDAGFNDGFVVQLEVQILGNSPSGAIDNLVFSIPEPTTWLLISVAAACVALLGRTRRE